jgi:sugar/nucleoside kinase (ribokinase family)
MPYRDLLDRLGRLGRHGAGPPSDGSVVALPDGSVDIYYRVFAGRETAVDTRAAFADRIADGRTSSLRAERRSREAGGQAVNLARQAAALDLPVTLYGHLDDPVFDGLPFPTRSMGTPATVRVYGFEDDDLMLSEDSTDLRTWSLADLRAVPGAIPAIESASVVCCVNWVSVRGMDAALRDLAGLDVEGTTVLVDPGDVTGFDEEELVELLASIRRLAEETTVVASANGAEIAALATAAGIDSDALGDRLAGLREHATIAAAVSHERERAVAHCPDGRVSVPNIDAPRVRRRTGSGDRFDGALAAALAADWDWEVALALANACASYHVTIGQTADVDALGAFLRDVSLPGRDGP